MKSIMVVEKNSHKQIQSVKHLIKDFGFDGLNLYFLVPEKNVRAVKNILGNEIVKCEPAE